MHDETVTPLEKLDAPWGKFIEVQDVVYDGGVRMVRVRIREGRRFTIVDLDPVTAGRLGGLLADWAGRNG